MPPPSLRPHIRVTALAHYFEVAAAAGLNPQALLRRVGLLRRTPTGGA
jgi:hypothetical protein